MLLAGADEEGMDDSARHHRQTKPKTDVVEGPTPAPRGTCSNSRYFAFREEESDSFFRGSSNNSRNRTLERSGPDVSPRNGRSKFAKRGKGEVVIAKRIEVGQIEVCREASPVTVISKLHHRAS